MTSSMRRDPGGSVRRAFRWLGSRSILPILSTSESSTSIMRDVTGRVMHRIGVVGLSVSLLLTTPHHPLAQTSPRFEYRVVFVAARQLERQLESAGRDGYGCVAVARAEPGLNAPGLVVVLGRQAGGSLAPVSHRVVTGSGSGTDLQPLLDRAGGEGFHLCGVVLDEGAAMPAVVAVMSHPATRPRRSGTTAWRC